MLTIEELRRSRKHAELLGYLEKESFTEQAVCRRLGLRRLADFPLHPSQRQPLVESEDGLDCLIRIFLCGEYEAHSALLAHLGGDVLDVLQGMGLLVCAGERSYAACALYPVEDLLIASDRWTNPDHSPFLSPEDSVYPAMLPNTRLFLDLIPRGDCESFLDLCSGTGVAALLAARSGAAHVWAGDIAERSTAFAEFNARLNGIANCSAVTSDLYDHLGGQTFDRIVSHPPYVPTLTPKWIFYSGGEDGEQVTSRIVSGLPAHLRDRGICCCLTMGSDRRSAPFERRVRGWLGPEESQFDVALVVRTVMDPEEFARRSSNSAARRLEETAAWKNLFSRLGVEGLVYGLVLIQRRSDAARTFTVRRKSSSCFDRAQWEWLLAWETAATRNDLSSMILNARPRANHEVQLHVVHRLSGREWEPQEFVLKASSPFEMECRSQPWMAHLMSLCDGQKETRQHMATLKERGVIQGNVPEDEFANAVATMVSGGFLEIEEFRLPRAAG